MNVVYDRIGLKQPSGVQGIKHTSVFFFFQLSFATFKKQQTVVTAGFLGLPQLFLYLVKMFRANILMMDYLLHIDF